MYVVSLDLMVITSERKVSMVKISKYKKIIVSALIGGAGLLSVPAINAQDMEISKGSVIAATCYTCHANYGASVKGMPSIDGMPSGRMKKALMDIRENKASMDFKENKSATTVMGRHASGYTDEEITEVATFLGKQAKKGE